MAALAERQTLFENQLDRHRGILYKVVGTFAWRAEDQQDLSQEIVYQLWRAFGRYDSNRPFSTWMYQVGLNTAISWSRKHKFRRQPDVSLDAVAEVAAPQEQEGRANELYTLIAALDELDKALITLYLDDLSYAEICEILGITERNVGVKLHRLKARLRLEAESQETN